MAKLTDSIGTFLTGDLVFTRYPPKGVQPIHVTVFLEPRVGLGASYVHAGATHLELANISTYVTDKDSGGYLHAHPTDPTLRANTAAVAQLFAQTAQRTPYGSYPSTPDFNRMGIAPKSPHASRFTGMIRTLTCAEIPFEFAALRRLLKWTLRAIQNETLSENRGITCAAFVAICHQVARMRAFLEGTGTAYQPDKIVKCLQKLDTLVHTKESLRANLELLGTDQATGKKIYRDQAYRENSNRELTPQGRRTLTESMKDVQRDQLDDTISDRLKKRANAPLSELERTWLVVQTQYLEIHAASAQLLETIIGAGFLFDAKYVSSPALAARLQTLQDWRTVEYKDY